MQFVMEMRMITVLGEKAGSRTMYGFIQNAWGKIKV